MVTGILAR